MSSEYNVHAKYAAVDRGRIEREDKTQAFYDDYSDVT
jgi:hypothetical protein